jgi:hypothetical protein
MPQVNGKKFAYTTAGMAAAAAYRKLSKKDDEKPFGQRNQPKITRAEVLKDIPQPQMGETQGEFVKGQLGALDEGDRGQLNQTNTKIARQILVEFYRNWRAKQVAANRGKKVR